MEWHWHDQVGSRALLHRCMQLGGKQIAQRLGHAALSSIFQRDYALADDALIHCRDAQGSQRFGLATGSARRASRGFLATTRSERATTTRAEGRALGRSPYQQE